MVSSNVVNNETVKVGNDSPTDELMDVTDKQVIEDQYEKEISIISVNSLNSGTVTVDKNAEIPRKSKWLRKVPIIRSVDFFYSNTKSS
jgi:hypothetical protein